MLLVRSRELPGLRLLHTLDYPIAFAVPAQQVKPESPRARLLRCTECGERDDDFVMSGGCGSRNRRALLSRRAPLATAGLSLAMLCG
jgi:hypothetical protein